MSNLPELVLAESVSGESAAVVSPAAVASAIAQDVAKANQDYDGQSDCGGGVVGTARRAGRR